MAIGDIYRAEIHYKFTSGLFFGETVHYYRQETDPVFGTAAEDLAVALAAEAVPSIMNPCSASFMSNNLLVRGVTDPTTGFEASYVAQPGGQTGEAYDLAMGLRMIWRTGLLGRSFQGRNTFPPTSEAQVTSGGTLLEAFRVNAQALFDDIIDVPADAIHGGWRLVVQSRFSDGIERPAPIYTPVVSGTLNARHGILRQRRDF